MTEKLIRLLRLQGLACDWSKHNEHSRNICSVHGFLSLSVILFHDLKIDMRADENNKENASLDEHFDS